MRRRPWRTRITIGLIATSVVAALAGCSAPGPDTPQPADTSSTPAVAASSATTSASAPLQCADLVQRQEVVIAFTRGGASSSGSITAITPFDGELTGPVAVTGAGGLTCAWSVRTSAWSGPASTLLVQVLPEAASQWSALMYGDGPTSDRRQFAGITAAATCGDPGCGASAVVGSSWVRVDMTVPGINGTRSPFGGESAGAILDDASPMISRVFSAVQHASADRLAFPKHPGSTAGAPRCDSILPTADIAPLLSSSAATYQQRPLNGATYSIAGAASADLGSYSCFGSATGGTADITVAPGQAWAVRAMEGSRYFDSAPLRPTRLTGATGSETAETTCVDGGANECTTVFSLGDLAIQVDGTANATRIAAAIIARAR